MEKKLLKLFGGVLLLILALIGFSVQSHQDRQNLSVDFLDVGQGDAILIKTPYEQNILIDGGPDASVLSQLGVQLSFFDKQIDLMILTHPHADHVDGLIDVLKRYQVKEILMTGVLHTAPDYLAFLDEIKKQNIPVVLIDKKQDINLGENLNLEILYPTKSWSGQKTDNLNNTSIVSRLVYKENEFLFTGDLAVEGEAELLKSDSNLQSDVLKVGHHGSKYSSSDEFLKAVKPTLAIISVGANNDFGHPHFRTLEALKNIGAKILRTDLMGDIDLVSDGYTIIQK